MLKTFHMEGCKPIPTPLEINLKLSQEDESEPVDSTMYRRLVGSLIYLANTRPDISYDVGLVSQFSAQPKESHWKAAKRILRYVQGTLSMGLVYEKDGGNILNGFCDSDWAGDKDTRRSTSGYCFYIGGAAISWSSKKQKTIALSSAEAEYKAATTAVGEALWLRRILEDGGQPQIEPTLI